MRRFLFCALLLGLVASAYGYSNRPRKQTVYMFGFAASHTDSVSVITDLQIVDAYVMTNGFLADRTLYGLQLNNFLLTNKGLQDMTCVVFFDKKKSKAEKKYQKIRKRYRSAPEVILQSLGVDVFRFQTEEWVDETITETLSTDTPKE